MGWIIGFGFIILIFYTFALSSQLEKHKRAMAEIRCYSGEVLAKLEQLNSRPPHKSEPLVGVVLQRRSTRGGDPLTPKSRKGGKINASDFPRRTENPLLF